MRIIEDSIQHTGSALESTSFGDRIGITRPKESIKNLLRLMKGRQRTTFVVVGKCAGTSRFAHAAIGPSCAVARIAPGGTSEVWSHTQGVVPLRY